MDDLRLHDPIAISKYGASKGILNKPGWEWTDGFLPRAEELREMVQALHIATHDSARFKFGVQVPKNVKEALEFDKHNKNTLWEDAIATEL